MSTDELTQVQALERLAPDLPPRPGQVARREFEYQRHGTCSFFINFDVASHVAAVSSQWIRPRYNSVFGLSTSITAMGTGFTPGDPVRLIFAGNLITTRTLTPTAMSR